MGKITEQPRIAAIKGEMLKLAMRGASGRPIPSQMDIIRRSAAISGANADRVREDALMSGALPGEFEVVHIYRRGIAYTGMEARLK